MDEELMAKVADMISIYSYKLDAVIDLLVERNIASKEEINDVLNRVMEDDKKRVTADDYIIDELKNRVFLK